MDIPILSVVGRSGVGKTTLIEILLPELKTRGYRVATIKHHSHPGFEIDQPGKDTWRHAQAGSDHVVIAAPDKIANIRLLDEEMTLDQIISEINGVDIILTEGYKRAGKPAIEVIRKAKGLDLLCSPEQLIAIATDTKLDINTPQFSLDSARELCDFIEQHFLFVR